VKKKKKSKQKENEKKRKKKIYQKKKIRKKIIINSYTVLQSLISTRNLPLFASQWKDFLLHFLG
jgi:hypothetical protein